MFHRDWNLHKTLVWWDGSFPNLFRTLDTLIFGHGYPGTFEMQCNVFLQLVMRAHRGFFLEAELHRPGGLFMVFKAMKKDFSLISLERHTCSWGQPWLRFCKPQFHGQVQEGQFLLFGIPLANPWGNGLIFSFLQSCLISKSFIFVFPLIIPHSSEEQSYKFHSSFLFQVVEVFLLTKAWVENLQ